MTIEKPLVLFVSVILIDSPRYPGLHFQALVENELRTIRESQTVFTWQTKKEVFKYMLASLTVINWDGIYIDLEAGEGFTPNDIDDVLSYAQMVFKCTIKVGNQRCTSKKAYVKRLKQIKTEFPDAYIFYTPNHDHVFMASDTSHLYRYINIARDLRSQTNSPVRVCYSHQMESLIASDPKSPLFNKNLLGGICLEENVDYRIVGRSNYAWDSFYIAHIDDLFSYFYMSEVDESTYAPRGEDLYFYPFPSIENIVIIPKTVLCHHYDGYYHFFRDTDFYVSKADLLAPPLFIPPGFFDKKIKVRFGFHDCDNGAVSIHPNPDALCFMTNPSVGVKIICDFRGGIGDIPLFWVERIASIMWSEDTDISGIQPAKLEHENLAKSIINDLGFNKTKLHKYPTPNKLSLAYNNLDELQSACLSILDRIKTASADG
jgi:hypothetical protein